MKLLWLRWGFVPVMLSLNFAMDKVGDPPFWLYLLAAVGIGLAWPTAAWQVER